jgi:hypothetical protein
MADQRLARHKPSPVELARAEVGWLDDDDAELIEQRDVATAVGLSLISGGGGHFYVGDNITGIGLCILALTALIAGPMWLPLSVAFLPLVVILGGAAVASARKAKKVNRFVVLKRQHELESAPYPQSYKLLAAVAQVDSRVAQNAVHSGYPAAAAPSSEPPPPEPPSPHQELIDKLRKLMHLRDAEVISEIEHRERKVDLLSAAATGMSRDQLDELLFELLPLIQEGTLVREDVEFLKSLGT